MSPLASVGGPGDPVRWVDGEVGRQEVWIDAPAVPPCGMVLIAHPQPLMGGHAGHKVPTLLARALCGAGWLAVRPNFRGVGGSEGAHDHGDGEHRDLLLLVEQMRAAWPDLPLALVGFSFGAHVQARVAAALVAVGRPAWRVALLGLPSGRVAAGRCYDTPPCGAGTLVLHGERDEQVPLASVLDWARPSAQPVLVLPGADHGFTGQMPLLREAVCAHLGQGPGR